MDTDALDYELPEDAIAQEPAEPRDAARLLVDLGPDRPPGDAVVADLDRLLVPGDLMVLNETRVLPARVAVRRSTGGRGEVLLLEPWEPRPGPAGAAEREHGWWAALCRPSRRLRSGEVVRAERGELAFEVGDTLSEGRRLVRPLVEGPLLDALEESGSAPLPPYIRRGPADRERYQTVYARTPASAAAPTAGLHLSAELLDRLADRGVELATVDLVVGLDTFRPISTERVEDHRIHTERYVVPPTTWQAAQRARAEGRRIVAIGTTTVRALESAARSGELRGRTDLFIVPGFDFAVTDLLLTNFHLPRSSLLALVEAFVGPRWRDLYATALERGYRFLSFGDAMLLRRAGSPAGERA